MPNIVREELWEHPGMIVVTTNATITHRGLLVMGRGAPLQAKQRYPRIAKECADVIREATRSVWSYPAPYGDMAMGAYDMECEMEDMDGYSGVGYYFQVIRPPCPDENKVGFGIFQVKAHFRDNAHLELIRRSVVALREYCRNHPDVSIRMNYPGIGYGHLGREAVKPLLVGLPDNVTICYH